MIAAAARVASRRQPAVQIAKRYLGETVHGPASITDFGSNLRHAVNFFCKAPVGYYEFRQQCQSLRIFAFVGVCAGCTFSLFWNPPKSSYWQRYSPRFLFSLFRDTFLGARPPL